MASVFVAAITPPEYVGVKAAALHLGVNPRTVYRWIDRGVLDAQYYAGRWRITQGELDRIRAARSTRATHD